VQLIRSYVAHRTPEELLSVMGAGAAAIAQLDGEIERRLPELPDLPSLPPEQARFRLFDSITMFLKNASSLKPIVLLLDDLHWADLPSLLLLQFLSKELPTTRLLVIGTYRDLTLDRRHPLRHLLAVLAGDGLDHRIELKGLGESDVARFIEMTTGATPPTRLASAVYRETEGNPFFVKEVVRLLVATGQLDRVDDTSTWTVTLPDGVREVVIRRLAQVSSSCNRLLEIAAVMGREFALSAVERLAGLGHSLLLEAIEEAIAARLVTELSATPALYRFSHALIRETVYEGLSALERARLHLQIGELLVSTHGESSDAPLEALAHHFFQAISLGQADKAVLYATRAGERADRLLAYEDAVSHYEMALRALDLKSGVDEGQRCELLLSLGEVQMKAGLSDLAYETFERAATLARQHGAVEALARAALDIGAGTAARTRLGHEVDDVQIGLLREALSHSHKLSSSIHARLLSQLSLALYHSPPDRLVLSEQAVDVARGSGDSAARLASLYSRCIALEGFNRADERLALATELVQEAERAGDAEMALRGHYRCLRELLELADLGGVERELGTYGRLANELRQPRYLWYVPFCRASLDCANGRLDEAERLLTEALSIGQRAQDVNATLFCTVLRNAVLWLAGRFDESELLIKSLVGKYPVIQSWRAQLARLYCFMGRLEDARREFEHLAQNDFDDLIIDGSFVSILSQLCTVSWFLGDGRRAEQLYGRLEPYGERIIVAGNTAISGGAASFGLAMAASANGRWEAAEQRFRHAIDITAQIEAWSWLGLTKCGYAWMLSARQQPGDREHVAALRHEVQDLSRQLNMSWLISWFPNTNP
jgi:tetratricopeptide (TPR) repeat protein